MADHFDLWREDLSRKLMYRSTYLSFGPHHLIDLLCCQQSLRLTRSCSANEAETHTDSHCASQLLEVIRLLEGITKRFAGMALAVVMTFLEYRATLMNHPPFAVLKILCYCFGTDKGCYKRSSNISIGA